MTPNELVEFLNKRNASNFVEIMNAIADYARTYDENNKTDNNDSLLLTHHYFHFKHNESVHAKMVEIWKQLHTLRIKNGDYIVSLASLLLSNYLSADVCYSYGYGHKYNYRTQFVNYICNIIGIAEYDFSQ